jgi:hypothetical protein
VVYKQGDDGESPKFKKIVIQHHRQKHLEMKRLLHTHWAVNKQTIILFPALNCVGARPA